MIELSGISFAYRREVRPVLRGFSATFDSAMITALTGPNACGKTTLLKLMVGVERPEAGAIVVDGSDIADLSLAQIARRVGYVQQNPAHQIFCTSVRDEISYGLGNLGLNGDQVEDRIQRYLDRFGLLGHIDDFPLDLSLGERQRLMLAVVLAMRPAYLALDEPTTGLDLASRRALGAHLREAADNAGCGVIVATHERGFISRFADEELRMGDARDARQPAPSSA